MSSPDNSDDVELSLNKSQLLAMLKRAASQERTVIEFRTTGHGAARKLDSAMDITEHVESLEEEQNRTQPAHE